MVNFHLDCLGWEELYIVSNDEMASIDDRRIRPLNLLYWSVSSNNFRVKILIYQNFLWKNSYFMFL